MSDSSRSGSPASNSSVNNNSKRVPLCARCRNHSQSVPVKDHKRFCKYKNCVCDACTLIIERSNVNNRQKALNRKQERTSRSGDGYSPMSNAETARSSAASSPCSATVLSQSPGLIDVVETSQNGRNSPIAIGYDVNTDGSTIVEPSGRELVERIELVTSFLTAYPTQIAEEILNVALIKEFETEEKIMDEVTLAMNELLRQGIIHTTDSFQSYTSPGLPPTSAVQRSLSIPTATNGPLSFPSHFYPYPPAPADIPHYAPYSHIAPAPTGAPFQYSQFYADYYYSPIPFRHPLPLASYPPPPSSPNTPPSHPSV